MRGELLPAVNPHDKKEPEALLEGAVAEAQYAGAAAAAVAIGVMEAPTPAITFMSQG